MRKPRLESLDATKGLAIILVVLGHLVARQSPSGCEWYEPVRAVIYSFHMPLFIFLCGIIQSYTQSPIQSLGDYVGFLKKKTSRLAPAWVLFATIIFAGKYLASFVTTVDNGVTGLSDYFTVFIKPKASFSAYLWFIYVLYVYYLLTPLAYYITRRRIEWLLPVGVGLLLMDVSSPLFAAHSLATYALYYLIGLWCGDHVDFFQKAVSKVGALTLIVFAGLIAYVGPFDHSMVVMGLLSIPALIWVVGFAKGQLKEALMMLGQYSFVIYLMNTILIGVVKGVFLKVVSWDNAGFLIMLPALIWGGVYAPVMIKNHIINRIPYLRKVIA